MASKICKTGILSGSESGIKKKRGKSEFHSQVSKVRAPIASQEMAERFVQCIATYHSYIKYPKYTVTCSLALAFQ